MLLRFLRKNFLLSSKHKKTFCRGETVETSLESSGEILNTFLKDLYTMGVDTWAL